MSREADRAGRLVLKGGLSSALGFLIRFFARLVFLFVAGRLFGAALFGAYSIAVALVEIGVIAAGLGTRWTLFQWLDDHDQSKGRPVVHALFDAAVPVTLASAALAASAMLAVAMLPASLIAGNSAAAIFWLAPMIVLQALIELFLAATRWKRIMRHEVVGKSLVQPYAGVAAALAAYAAGAQAHGLLISYVAGTLAAAFYAWFALRRSFGALRLRAWRPDLAALRGRRATIAANAGSEAIEGLYTRLDIYAVGILLGEAAAGLYAMARQVSLPIRQVRQAFDGLLVPVMAKTLLAVDADSGRAMASASRLILVVQLPFVIVLVAAGAPLLALFGPGFAAGYGALVFLALAEAVQGAFGVGDLMFVYRRPGLGVAITAASSAIGAAAILLLAAPLGLAGIGLAMLLSWLARALVRRHMLRTRFGLALPAGYHLGPILAAAAAIGAALALSSNAELAAAAGLAIYGVALMAWLRATGARLLPEGLVAGGVSAAG